MLVLPTLPTLPTLRCPALPRLQIVDPNHLVTTGAEGFIAEGDPSGMAKANPDAGDSTLWAARSGQDFRANHAHPAIDYASSHMWADNWRRAATDTAWGQQWIAAQALIARQLGKPLILEEFGKEAAEGNITSVRDPWFVMVHGEVDKSLQSGGTLRGALFWQWDGTTGARSRPSNCIRPVDSTFSGHIVPFAHKMAGVAGGAVPGCAPRPSAPGGASQAAAVKSFSGSAAGRKLRGAGGSMLSSP